jgi:hypothetical protein
MPESVVEGLSVVGKRLYPSPVILVCRSIRAPGPQWTETDDARGPRAAPGGGPNARSLLARSKVEQHASTGPHSGAEGSGARVPRLEEIGSVE